ncbi:glycerophosphodiester phosphodiesterase [Shewanella sp. AS16]|uniref:glycerophosphodiester phosphodiesterase n=1 Tax=Shewanella sp. AS16 TaxID=2907625 RepID=UPI001F440214|nr:glycerophosphodiester phosphodiesterase [Shewanella sp. AS16]MCE9687038.1 glycerophosphodiester phosphodiesterase [Shewanella sp. AS16]
MLIFAHRGASGYAPENTLAAMEKALALGAEAIELDVHNVAGELMVFHDRRLEGKSSGKGLIHLTSRAELAGIRVGGEPIPSLWQVLELVGGRCIINIELKGIDTVTPFLALYPKALTELGYKSEQLLISSFNHPYLQQVKQALPHARVAPLLAGIPLDKASIASQLNAFSLHLDIAFIDRALIEDAHARGVRVYVYTVDDGDDIRALQQLGVDGIFSNYPDRAAEALAKSQANRHGQDYSHWFE